MASSYRSGLDDPSPLANYPSAANPLTVEELMQARPVGFAPTTQLWQDSPTSQSSAINTPQRAEAAVAGAGATADDNADPQAPLTPPWLPGSTNLSAFPQATPQPSTPTAPKPPAQMLGEPSSSWIQPQASAAPATAPVSPSARDYGMRGLSALDQNLQSATSATESIPTSSPQVDQLAQRVAADSTPTPLRIGPNNTGPVDPNYRASLGTRILRGVRSGAIGLLTGGIPGAIVGAIEPQDIAGGHAYGAPNRLYDQTEAARQARLGSDQEQYKSAFDRWKEAVDASKARAAEYRANAGLGKDLTSGAVGLQNSDTDRLKADTDQQRVDQSSPTGKAAEQTAISEAAFNQRMTLLRRIPNLPAATQAYYLLNGKVPDPQQPRQPSAEEIMLGQAMRAFRTDNGRTPNYQETMQMIDAVHGRAGSGGAATGGGGRAPAEQALIDEATDDVNSLKSRYKWDASASGADGKSKGAWVDAQDPYDDKKWLTAQEYTSRKNQIVGKLNQKLTSKKYGPLNLQFDPQTDIQRDGGGTTSTAGGQSGAPPVAGAVWNSQHNAWYQRTPDGKGFTRVKNQ